MATGSLHPLRCAVTVFMTEIDRVLVVAVDAEGEREGPLSPPRAHSPDDGRPPARPGPPEQTRPHFHGAPSFTKKVSPCLKAPIPGVAISNGVIIQVAGLTKV